MVAGIWLKVSDMTTCAVGRSVGLDAHSPVEFVVVVMCLPPEVKPDEQQAEGKEEDEGPQQLPL